MEGNPISQPRSASWSNVLDHGYVGLKLLDDELIDCLNFAGDSGANLFHEKVASRVRRYTRV